MTVRQIWELWKGFWFTPQSPAPLCAYRILYGLLVLACCLLWAPDLQTWFGTHGIVSIDTMQQYEGAARFSLLYMLPPSDGWVVALFIALIISAICVTLGLFTRSSLIVLFLLLISFHHRNPVLLNSGDTFLRISGFILMFSPAGELFSLDRFIKKRRGLSVEDTWTLRCPVWTLRLLQLQIAAVYCQAFWDKILGDTWWSGTAVYYASRLEEFQRLPLPYIMDHMWTLKAMTWGTLVFEFSFWTLIWIKDFRYYVLLVGILFHLGLEWTFNIPLFEFIMIASYLNFVDPEDLKRALEFLNVKFGATKAPITAKQ